MAVAEEKGGAPVAETYEEYLARQYAEGNVHSTGNGDASNYAYGQAAVNNAAPPPESTGLPTQQETLDYYASQSINDYGPPPQPEYAPTQIAPGAAPPPPLPTLPDWASPLRDPRAADVVKELPLGNLMNAMLQQNYADYAAPPPEPTPPPLAGSESLPPSWFDTPRAPTVLVPPYWAGESPPAYLWNRMRRSQQRRNERRAGRGKPPREE